MNYDKELDARGLACPLGVRRVFQQPDFPGAGDVVGEPVVEHRIHLGEDPDLARLIDSSRGHFGLHGIVDRLGLAAEGAALAERLGVPPEHTVDFLALVGDSAYKRALDLYFDRHDGDAATIESENPAPTGSYRMALSVELASGEGEEDGLRVQVLRYEDRRLAQRRAIGLTLEGADTYLSGFVLSGDTRAERWIHALLLQRLPVPRR